MSDILKSICGYGLMIREKKKTIKKQQHCPIYNCSESPSSNRMQPNEKQTNMNLNTRHLNDDPTIADIVFRLHFAFTAEWLYCYCCCFFFFHIQTCAIF